MDALNWDLFCRVVDNYGDAGVCWRLAADLAERGHRVRLWIDEPAPLAWMAPQGAPSVELRQWDDGEAAAALPGEVVVEAFGCDPPAGFVAAMARRAQGGRPPLWINLEHLSAEPYVERSHRLPSPQFSGPGAGLTKWFFYPGFTPRTGGLLRERGLLAAREAFPPQGGARRVLLFGYPGVPLPALLAALAAAGEPPARLLLCPGALQAEALEALAAAPSPRLQAEPLPFLPQPEFDRSLWGADLLFVRGEDSIVRAQWAGVPFVWQIYPQHDGAHAAKLDAFLDLFLADAPPALADAVRRLWWRWNGLSDEPPDAPLGLPPLPAWAAHCRRWRDGLAAQPDLVTQLLGFVAEKR